jgi:hypothetical protein
MPDDDDPILIDHDRLPEAEFADRCGHGVDGRVVQARVILLRPNGRDVAFFNLHRGVLRAGKHAPLYVTYPEARRSVQV